MIFYFYETLIEFKKKWEIHILSDSVLHYFRWAKTMQNDYPKSITDFVPWMNFNVISFLNKYLTKDMTVLNGVLVHQRFFFLKEQIM